MLSVFLTNINGDKAYNSEWENHLFLQLCYNIRCGFLGVWKINSFPPFNIFFQLDFCAVLHLVALGFLFSSYKQVLLALLATAEKGAEPECLLPFSLLTPLKASSFPQGACKKLSLGSWPWGAVCHSNTERTVSHDYHQSRFLRVFLLSLSGLYVVFM